jgi:hypothetical protein
MKLYEVGALGLAALILGSVVVAEDVGQYVKHLKLTAAKTMPLALSIEGPESLFVNHVRRSGVRRRHCSLHQQLVVGNGRHIP